MPQAQEQQATETPDTENAIDLEYDDADPFGLAELDALDLSQVDTDAPDGDDDSDEADDIDEIELEGGDDPDGDEEDDPEDDTEEEGEGDEDDEDETEEPSQQVQPKKKKNRTAAGRIKDLSTKLKDKDALIAQLQQQNNNLMQGQQWLNSQNQPKAEPVSLDDQLAQAAQMAGDAEFNLDDFVTEAEKKTALMAYQTKASQQQQQRDSQVIGIKQQYAQVVEEYRGKDENTSNGLIAAYNVAVAEEARAIQRRYGDGITPEQARYHAERGLLEEAMQTNDPVIHIAKYGKQILEDRGASLRKKKKPAKIDHKNREAVKRRAGKPEIDTMPMTKAGKKFEKDFQDVSDQW